MGPLRDARCQRPHTAHGTPRLGRCGGHSKVTDTRQAGKPSCGYREGNPGGHDCDFSHI